MKTLVYMRRSTAKVAKVTQRAIVRATKTSRLGGLWKFGITPAGGLIAGPSSSVRSAAWACSWAIAVVELAISLEYKVRLKTLLWLSRSQPYTCDVQRVICFPI